MHAPNYTEIIETNGDFTYKYFKIGDSGKNLVFLHGLAGCKDSQPHFFKQLLENNTCYFLDLPGHNFLNAGEIKTVESFNLYLNNFLSFNKIDNPIFIGFSIGGNICYNFCKDFYRRTGKIIPTILWSSPLFIKKSYMTFRSKLSVFMLGILPDWAYKSKSLILLNKLLKLLRIPLSTTGVAALYNEYFKIPLFPTNKNEKTLFVYGTNDVFVNVEIYDELKLIGEGQQKHLVENGGHFGPDEAQQKSVGLIKKYIDDVLV